MVNHFSFHFCIFFHIPVYKKENENNFTTYLNIKIKKSLYAGFHTYNTYNYSFFLISLVFFLIFYLPNFSFSNEHHANVRLTVNRNKENNTNMHLIYIYICNFVF